MPMSDRIYIFDTTLRDGEQSPGCSMNTEEKLLVAQKLVDLGVDILEAGFPIASEGDFDAVRKVGAEFPGTRVAALARAVPKDIERAATSPELSAASRSFCGSDYEKKGMEAQGVVPRAAGFLTDEDATGLGHHIRSEN